MKWLGVLFLMLGIFGCDDPVSSDVSSLNGKWGSGGQYETVLTFNNGKFEWTWDGDLEQRGIYDVEDKILTVTIKNNYGSPQRFLGDYSRPYSIKGDTLTWGAKYGKK